MGSFNVSGFDDLQKELQRMESAAREMDGEHEVSFSELFTNSFMRKYTQFSNFDELLSAGGFSADTTEEFEAIPDELLDAHIAANTKFTSWEEMLEEATDQYVIKKLGF